jgi:hypothetical protein
MGSKGAPLNESIVTSDRVEDNVTLWMKSNSIGVRVGCNSKDSSTTLLECSKSILLLLAIGILFVEKTLKCSESVGSIRTDDPRFLLGDVLSE